MPRNCAAVRVGCLRNVGTGGAGGEGVDGALRSVGYALGRQRAAVGIGTAGDGVESGRTFDAGADIRAIDTIRRVGYALGRQRAASESVPPKTAWNPDAHSIPEATFGH